jgi:hypothetical protein
MFGAAHAWRLGLDQAARRAQVKLAPTAPTLAEGISRRLPVKSAARGFAVASGQP